ncbi:MAG: tetratricopeptide repeat protein [Bradymonadia bacterium]
MNRNRIASLLVLFGLLNACGGSPKPKLEETQTPTKTEQAEGQPAAVEPVVKRLSTEELLGLLNEAREAVSNGDLSTAEEKFKEVILQSVEPADDQTALLAEARFNLAVLAEWQGDYERAKRDYEAALIQKPELGDAIVAVSRIMIREGDEAGALRYASGRWGSDKDSIPLINALNQVRLATGRDLAKVEQSSKGVLRKDERNVPAMLNLAVVYASAQKHELAVAILENAKAIDASDPEIYWRLGKSHAALGKMIAARTALESASKLPQGASAEVYNDLGLIYHRAGDFAGAELQFRRALARWPDMVPARINLGNSLKGQQRYAEALTVFNEARSIPSARTLVAYNLGILLFDGQFPKLKAIDRFKQSVELLNEYKASAKDQKMLKTVESYLKEIAKRIKVEEQREAQMRRSQKAPEGGSDTAEDESNDGADDSSDEPSEDIE